MNHFAVFCMLHGVDLEDFETFISQLESEKAPAGRELRERLNAAETAYSNASDTNPLNTDTVKRHLEWILLRKWQIEAADKIAPYIMDDEQKAEFLANSRSDQARDAAEKRNAEKKMVKEHAKELARQHWANPNKKNRLTLSATVEDVFQLLKDEGYWNDKSDWGDNAVKDWIRDLPERPEQKAGRKPKSN